MLMFDSLAQWMARRRKPRPAPVPVPPPSPPVPDGSLSDALLAAHNRIRAANGKPPLAWSTVLDVAARGHATVMAQSRSMAHQGIGDGTPFTRIRDAGYRYANAGENVAAGYPDVATVMAAWQADAPHLANIVGPYAQMGGAMARDASGTPYWCVDFGTPARDGVGIGGRPIDVRMRGDGISCTYLAAGEAIEEEP